MQSIILKPCQPIQYTPSDPTLKALFTRVQHLVSHQQRDLVVDLLTQARHDLAHSRCKVDWDKPMASHLPLIRSPHV